MVIYLLTIVLPVCVLLWLGIGSLDRQREAIAALTAEKLAAEFDVRVREAAAAAFDNEKHPLIDHAFTFEKGELVRPMLRAPLPRSSPPAFAEAERVAGWMPDGSAILFTTDRGGTADLCSVALNTSRTVRPALVREDLGAASPLRVSSSGTLVYSVQTGGGSQTYSASFDFSKGAFTSEPIAIDPSLRGSTGPAQWSPDGTISVHRRRASVAPGSRTTLLLRLPGGATREVPDLTAFGPLRCRPHWWRGERARSRSVNRDADELRGLGAS
jgi:hypothetical protein